MRVREKLLELARIIADRAERDPEFAETLGGVLGLEQPRKENFDTRTTFARRPKNRRRAAVLDPVVVIRENGEDILRSRLLGLGLDQLRDIVADYGMDPGRLVMKWKQSSRVVNRIVEISLSRSQKGDAFRA